jgi:hypothetical protein
VRRKAGRQVEKARRPDAEPSPPAALGLIDRAWVGLLVAVWVVAVVAIYYRQQVERLVELLSR